MIFFMVIYFSGPILAALHPCADFLFFDDAPPPALSQAAHALAKKDAEGLQGPVRFVLELPNQSQPRHAPMTYALWWERSADADLSRAMISYRESRVYPLASAP